MKSLFALCFVLGAALIIYGKLALHSMALAILAPNIIICAYAVLIATQPKVHRSASDADNLYYLGFLFTIVSLGSTLFTFDTTSASLAQTLIQGFGVALSTTIIGLFLRTLLLPHHIDIGEQDQAARLQLYDATNEFIKALSQNTHKLNDAFDGNTSRMSKAFEVAADNIGTSLPKQADRLTLHFQEFNEQVSSSLHTTLQEMQKLPIAIKQTTERLDIEHGELLIENMRMFQETAAGFMESLKTHNEQVGMLGRAIERLRTRVEEVGIEPDLLKGHVAQVYGIYEQAAVSAATTLKDSSDTFEAAVGGYFAATQQLSEQLGTIAASMSQIDSSKVAHFIEQGLEPLSRAAQSLMDSANQQSVEWQSRFAELNGLVAELKPQRSDGESLVEPTTTTEFR